MARKKARTTDCPCGSGRPFDACCAPYLEGASAPTPEALMRSRYTAYALGRDDYVLATWDEATRPTELFEPGEPRPRWIGLTVLAGRTEGDRGEVCFVARARSAMGAIRLEERSLFERRNDRWVYVRALEEGESL